jgi:hypothetical protein
VNPIIRITQRTRSLEDEASHDDDGRLSAEVDMVVDEGQWSLAKIYWRFVAPLVDQPFMSQHRAGHAFLAGYMIPYHQPHSIDGI